MKRKRYVAMLAVVLTVGLFTFLGSAQNANSAAQCRIVRVYDETTVPGEARIRLEPQEIAVEGKTCIIWVNLGKAEMKVTFTEGKKCVDGTESASGFSLSDACYITSWIPFGATSSLTFVEKGAYEYTIEWEASAAKAMGKIVVQ